MNVIARSTRCKQLSDQLLRPVRIEATESLHSDGSLLVYNRDLGCSHGVVALHGFGEMFARFMAIDAYKVVNAFFFHKTA